MVNEFVEAPNPGQLFEKDPVTPQNIPKGVGRPGKPLSANFDRYATPDFRPMNNIVFWNSLGFFLFGFLLRFAANQLMDASGTETGLVFSVQTFGGLLVSPIVGYLADRMSKKRLVLLGALGRGLSYLFLYVGLGISNLIVFATGGFILGLAAVYFWTPLNALVAQKTYKKVRSTAFGKQAGLIGRGNLVGAAFTIGYYYVINRVLPGNNWVLFLPLLMFCAFNVFAGIRFYRRVDEGISFDGYIQQHLDDPFYRGLWLRDQEVDGEGDSDSKGTKFDEADEADSADGVAEIGGIENIANAEELVANGLSVSIKALVPPAKKRAQKMAPAFILGIGFLLLSFMVSSVNQSLASPFLQIYVSELFFPGQDAYAVGLNIMLIYLPSEVLSQLIAPKLGEWGDKINPSVAIAFICGSGSLITWLLINTTNVYLFIIVLLVDTSLAWANGLVLANLISRISKNNRGKIFSARQWVTFLGAVIGPILGGWAWEYIGSRVPFIISIFVELSLIPLYLLSIYFLRNFMAEKI